MTSHNNFQSENNKNTKSISRTDIYNPSFNPTVDAQGNKEKDGFLDNLDKYVELVSWCRWNPDLWFDMITPPTGGVRLDLDQRVFLRCMSRFVSTYGVFPRGYGKTWGECLSMLHTSIFFPSIKITMTAQTKEAAAAILQEKYTEIIEQYPLLLNEIDGKPNFSKDDAAIKFRSGSIITILANQQSSKGRRRHRIQIEESAQINDLLFQDVLKPIVNVPRRTIGKEAGINPEELNGQINFFTTAYFRQSSEYERSIRMVDEMADLKGVIVLGSSWELACSYGRGEAKRQILEKKDTESPIFFATNYESKWVGQIDGGIVNIGKLMDLRIVADPEFKSDDKSYYLLSIDVARSAKATNNQSSVAVLKIKENSDGRISKIRLVNLIHISNMLSFGAQAVDVKRIKAIYNAKKIIVDSNGLGSGLLDELLKDTIDPLTGESLGCWDTENTDHEPEVKNSEKIIYALFSQGINHDIIVNFMDMVESQKLQLLVRKNDVNYDPNNTDAIDKIYPHVQTDLFIEEIANLKLKKNANGTYNVEQVHKKVNKDRYSSVSMGLWYIKTFLDKPKKVNDDFKKFMMTKKPSYLNK